MAIPNSNFNNSQLEKINWRKELRKYLKNWPWFLIAVMISVTGGYQYLKYTTPVYLATATIIIKNEPGQGSQSAIYSDLGLNGAGNNNVEVELGILRSKRLMKEVVKSLNFHIQYFKEGKVRTVEIYDGLPFSLQVLKLDELSLKNSGGGLFEISKSEKNNFKIKNLKTEKIIEVVAGRPFNLGFADVVISSNDLTNEKKSFDAIIVTFTDMEKIASHYRSLLNLIQVEKNSNLIELNIKDPVKEKARDILDQLILEYNRDAIEDKNLIAGNTAHFIDDRLAIINNELESVETGKESFKEENRLTDIQAESQIFMQNASEYNKRRQEVGMQLELSSAMLEYITSNSQSGFLPTNLGLSEGSVNNQINEYNALVLQRNRILAGSSEINPIVIKLNNQIGQIKGNIIQSLKSMRSNLLIGQDDINRQASSIGSKIFEVPSKERQYRGIERQQNIKETLYLFLLQKREENSLSMAVTEPKAKIVDRAYFHDAAISLNARSLYLGTVILGLFIPFSVIYINGALDNKVRKRSDIEKLSSNIALVGEIPKVSLKNEIICLNDRSVLAESFRILNTNLQYLLVNSKNKTTGTTIAVTSTIKGEGKTFTAINLGITLANTGKKVLLVGADLRNPKLQNYVLDTGKILGISDYLVGDNMSPESLIVKSKIHPDIYLLHSGSIPPNPYELLKQEKVGEMFRKLRTMYDYIIIDTAPSMPVADTFLITRYADLVLYVVRAGYTERELLEFPLNAKENKKLQNVSFVLNDLNSTNLGYGNKYGYGYSEDKKSFWRMEYFAAQFKLFIL